MTLVLKKIFFLGITILLLTGSGNSLVHAQTTPEIATSTPQTPEEAIEFRNKILDLFNIPHDTPMTLYDIMQGKTLDGSKIPNIETIMKIKQGPLSDMQLVFNEKNLAPGSTVQAVIASFSTNLQKARIAWYFNGKLVSSGLGNASYLFTLGSLGSTNSIKISVTAETGEHREITKIIYPSNIRLIWSADTYIPTWYQGKALPSGGSRITIFAMPSFYIGGSALNPANLIYGWSINSTTPTADSNISGVGKNSFSLDLSDVVSTSYTITVFVQDNLKRIVSQNSIKISGIRPSVEMYSTDPLYGVKEWLTGKKSFMKNGDAVSLIAEPFYAPLNDFANLQYSWRINNAKIGNSNSTERKLMFTTEPGSTGSQTIGVSYQSPTNIVQQGRGSATINVQ
ncbi:MAG: hypothetical protein AAB482_04445 [Patescibacteria group bacterium]